VAWAVRRRTAVSLSLATGTVLYLAYVVRVGGDFMSGRFLAPAFVCAVLFIAREAAAVVDARPAVLSGLAILVVVASLTLTTHSPWHIWAAPPAGGEPILDFHGIVDEQRIYYPYTGLVPRLRGQRPANHPWARAGLAAASLPHVMVFEAVGLLGYHAGPAVHIVDPMGLTDPVLARRPARVPWRIGHFARTVPDGYVPSLDACLQHVFPHGAIAPPAQTCIAWPDTNRIADPVIARDYDEVRELTEAPLFERARLRAIIHEQTGR
jgi:arabinofuranosyltransferase